MTARSAIRIHWHEVGDGATADAVQWEGRSPYLPAARRCQRVAFNIFLCFFLRMRLRRFLMRDPMSGGTLAEGLG